MMAAIEPLSSSPGAVKSAAIRRRAAAMNPRRPHPGFRCNATPAAEPAASINVLLLRPDDGDSRLRIAQVILDLVAGIRDIDGHEHRTQAQAGDVEKDRLGGFVDLNGHPVAALHAAPMNAAAMRPDCSRNAV